MKFTSSNRLVVGILLSASLWDCPDLQASRKMNVVPLGTHITYAMSANEELLIRLEAERKDLLRNRNKDTASHLLKNKLKILNGKIEFLERQVGRTKESPPAKIAVPTPVSVPVAARFQEYTKHEQRTGAQEATMPTKVKPRDFAAPEIRDVSQTRIVPAKVEPKALANIEGRAQAATLALPEKGKSKAKTGADWRAMSRADKEIYMLSLLGSFSRRDIFLEKPYTYYIDAVDKTLKDDVSQDAEYVQKIVLKCAYATEPESLKDPEEIRN